MYVFDKHVIEWGGGEKRSGKSGADSGIYFSGAPCIGEGTGDRQGLQRVQEGSPTEAHGNKEFEKLMILMTE